jgi:hypothetical protein
MGGCSRQYLIILAIISSIGCISAEQLSSCYNPRHGLLPRPANFSSFLKGDPPRSALTALFFRETRHAHALLTPSPPRQPRSPQGVALRPPVPHWPDGADGIHDVPAGRTRGPMCQLGGSAVRRGVCRAACMGGGAPSSHAYNGASQADGESVGRSFV